MTRPVWAWAGCRAHRRVGRPISRLPQLTVGVVLLCALCPSLATAWGDSGGHLGGRSIHTSLHPATHAQLLRLGIGERTRRGSSAVRRLQRGLRRAGYAPGPVDGRFGPLTAAAVARFQANHAVPVDGIVGPATRRAMRAVPVLELGAGETGHHGSAAVAGLQRLLRRAGFAPGPIDGRFGPRTERAVMEFQRARHLAVDGIAGPITQSALHGVQRTSTRSRGPQGGRTARQHRSAPVRHTAHTQHSRAPRPAQAPVPATPRPPLPWILLGLGVLGITAVLTSYYQRPLTARAARVAHAFRAMRTHRSAPSSVPEPPPLTFVIEEDNSGGFYWTIVTERGEVLARSARFGTYEEAMHAASLVHHSAGAALFQRRSGAQPGPARPVWPDETASSRGGRRR